MNYAATSTLISGTDIIDKMVMAVGETEKEAYLIIWDNLLSFLSENWFPVILVLTTLLVISFVRALFGRWGMFGSVLYHYLYFGTLFIIGLIFGPGIFANLFIGIVLVVLYVVCYLLVGNVLRSFGFH